jgi:hypothetical protein
VASLWQKSIEIETSFFGMEGTVLQSSDRSRLVIAIRTAEGIKLMDLGAQGWMGTFVAPPGTYTSLLAVSFNKRNMVHCLVGTDTVITDFHE